jgi:hypothetical protein
MSGGGWPRVHEVLQAVGLGPDLSTVDPLTLERARQRGIAVHRAIESMTYGLGEFIPDDVQPYAAGWERFLRESGFTPEICEFQVRHEAWRYEGHPDVLGWLGATRLLLDVKTGDPTGGDYQVVAYADAWNHQHPEQAVQAGAVLELTRHGTYRYAEVDLGALRPVWQAALVIWHARHRNGTRERQ